VLDLSVPSVLGNLYRGGPLSGSDFGSRRRKRRWKRIDKARDGESLCAKSSALLLSVALMGENGEISGGEGDGDTSGLHSESV
jgi:hypothetical protein